MTPPSEPGRYFISAARQLISSYNNGSLPWTQNFNILHQNTRKTAGISVRFTTRKLKELLISISFIPWFMHRKSIIPLSPKSSSDFSNQPFFLTSILLLLSSVVCCVQFSADGRYLATGCNHTTQIFDVRTGVKVWYVVVLLLLLSISKRRSYWNIRMPQRYCPWISSKVYRPLYSKCTV